MPTPPDGISTVPATAAEPLVYGTAQARWVLLATVLGSGLAQLDGTVVNVALPRIGQDLGADFPDQPGAVDPQRVHPDAKSGDF